MNEISKRVEQRFRALPQEDRDQFFAELTPNVERVLEQVLGFELPDLITAAKRSKEARNPPQPKEDFKPKGLLF